MFLEEKFESILAMLVSIVMSKLSSLAGSSNNLLLKEGQDKILEREISCYLFLKERCKGEKILPSLNYPLLVWKSSGLLVFTHLHYK